MFGIREMTYSPGFRETVQDIFGGMDRRSAASDGAIHTSLNMCAGKYPALTARPQRGRYAIVKEPNGFFARDCIAWVDGASLVVDSEEVAQLAVGPKLIAGIQKKICIWPDKVVYDRETRLLTQMEARWEGEAVFSNGIYAEEPALANTITVAGDLTELFRAGDGLAVTTVGESEQTFGAFVVQEVAYISDEQRTELRFLEETWRQLLEEGQGEDPSVTLQVCIRRRVPELEGVFEHHNRLWGWYGETICCCKLGDPTNWESFNADTTDSWELVTGSPGSITGGISYGGRPVFFKENRVIRLYGDYPAQFSTSEMESLGVEAGSSRSLAVAGDALYYKSPAGIMAYTGGYPCSVSEVFGEEQYRNAVAGSDGVRYYVSMEDSAGKSAVFAFDTRYRVWHQENGMQLVGLGWYGELYALEERGALWVLGSPRTQITGEEGIVTKVEFADFTEGTGRKKGVSRVVLRLEVAKGTELNVSVRYDSQGEWILLKTLNGEMIKGQAEIIVPIRRCDHYRIKLEGSGMGGSGWTLHSLTRERYVGSNRK